MGPIGRLRMPAAATGGGRGGEKETEAKVRLIMGNRSLASRSGATAANLATRQRRAAHDGCHSYCRWHLRVYLLAKLACCRDLGRGATSTAVVGRGDASTKPVSCRIRSAIRNTD